jgi:CP family cyanate transporter-like MFS transporter
MTVSLQQQTRRTPTAGSAVPGPVEPAGRPDWLKGSGVILAGIILIAANLRLCVSATGALLDSLSADLHLSSGVTSSLTSVWPLAFAVGGISGSRLARRFSVSTVLTGAVMALIAGGVLRGVPSEAALLGGSVLAGLGIALANVLLPAAVRQYFPDRIGLVTGLYATALSAGSAVAAGVSVPIAQGLGSPELGLAFWTLPAVAALAVWIGAGRQRAIRDHGMSVADRRAAKRAAKDAAGSGTSSVPTEPAGAAAVPAGLDPSVTAATLAANTDPAAAPTPALHIPLRALTRSPMAWSMAALFALQSMGAYVVMGWFPSILESAGLSAGRAGAMLSVTFFINIPVSFAVPILGSRMRDQRPLFFGLSVAMAASFTGLIFAPATLVWLWVVLMGFGLALFPLVLAQFSARGGSAAGTAALSTFGQSVGYLGAAVAPVAVGLMHTATKSWTLPLVCMVVVSLAQCAVALYVASNRHQALSSGAHQ